MKTQEDLLFEAKRLASLGQEYGSIIGQLEPENRFRMKAYVLNMDENIAVKTIYGAVTWKERVNVPKGQGRPRK